MNCDQGLDQSHIEQVALVALFVSMAVATPEGSVGYNRDYIQDSHLIFYRGLIPHGLVVEARGWLVHNHMFQWAAVALAVGTLCPRELFSGVSSREYLLSN